MEVFHFLIAICCSNVLLGTEFLNYLQDAALWDRGPLQEVASKGCYELGGEAREEREEQPMDSDFAPHSTCTRARQHFSECCDLCPWTGAKMGGCPGCVWPICSNIVKDMGRNNVCLWKVWSVSTGPTTLSPNVFQEHRKKHCDFHHSHQGMQGVDNRSRLFASTKRICSTAWCLALHSCSQHDCWIYWIYWAVGGCSFNSGWYGKKYGQSWLVHVWCNDQVLWYRRFRIERHALKSWCCIVERWRRPVERFSFYHCWILIVFNLCI